MAAMCGSRQTLTLRAKSLCLLRPSSSPFLSKPTKPHSLPHSPSPLSLHKLPNFTFRLPVELASVQSLIPLHSVTASALFTSLLSLHNNSWGCLSEGFATPL